MNICILLVHNMSNCLQTAIDVFCKNRKKETVLSIITLNWKENVV